VFSMVDLLLWVRDKPATQRVYLEDSYLRELEVEVLDFVLEKGRRYYVVFDKTIFHPRGGGQPSDTGVVVSNEFEFEVLKALEVGGVIVHYGRLVNGALKRGVQAKQVINWDHRYLVMRLHTAGHILDYAVINALKSPASGVEANHGPPEAYILYETPSTPSDRDVALIEEASNMVVESARTVKAYWVEPWELPSRVYNAALNLQKLPPRSKYRVVEIEGVNAIPCTGTHVKNTREVGRVRVTRVEPVDRGFKLVYSVVN